MKSDDIKIISFLENVCRRKQYMCVVYADDIMNSEQQRNIQKWYATTIDDVIADYIYSWKL